MGIINSSEKNKESGNVAKIETKNISKKVEINKEDIIHQVSDEFINSHPFHFDPSITSSQYHLINENLTIHLPQGKNFSQNSGALTAVCKPSVAPPFTISFKCQNVRMHQLFGFIEESSTNKNAEWIHDNQIRSEKNINHYHSYVSHIPHSHGVENTGRIYSNITDTVGKKSKINLKIKKQI